MMVGVRGCHGGQLMTEAVKEGCSERLLLTACCVGSRVVLATRRPFFVKGIRSADGSRW
jgi:hypothetical protein